MILNIFKNPLRRYQNKNNRNKIYTINYEKDQLYIHCIHFTSSRYQKEIAKHGLIPFTPKDLIERISNHLSEKYQDDYNRIYSFFSNLSQQPNLDREYLSLLAPRISNNHSILQNCIYAHILPYEESQITQLIPASQHFISGGEFIHCAEKLYLDQHPNKSHLQQTKNNNTNLIAYLIQAPIDIDLKTKTFKLRDDNSNQEHALESIKETIQSLRAELRFNKPINANRITHLSINDIHNLEFNLISPCANTYLNKLFQSTQQIRPTPSKFI